MQRSYDIASLQSTKVPEKGRNLLGPTKTLLFSHFSLKQFHILVPVVPSKMSVLTQDKPFVPPLRKSYFATPLAHQLDRLAETPITTPGLTGLTSPDSSNENVGSNTFKPCWEGVKF